MRVRELREDIGSTVDYSCAYRDNGADASFRLHSARRSRYTWSSSCPAAMMMDPWTQNDRAMRQLHVATITYGKPLPFPPVTLRKIRGSKPSATATDPGPKRSRTHKAKGKKVKSSRSLDDVQPAASSSNSSSLDHPSPADEEQPYSERLSSTSSPAVSCPVSPTSSPLPAVSPRRSASHFPGDFQAAEMYAFARESISNIQDSALARFERELAIRVPQSSSRHPPPPPPPRSQTPKYEDVQQAVASIQDSALHRLSTELAITPLVMR